MLRMLTVKRSRIIIIIFGALCSYYFAQAMNNDLSEGTKAPTPKLLRPRNGWQTPSPQLRKRNNARLSNCGYIAINISLQILFGVQADTIMKELELTGESIGVFDYYVSLFSFNVPITDDLIARMPEGMQLKREAKHLSFDQKKMIANHIKAVANDLVRQHISDKLFDIRLEAVGTENGDWIAYFKEYEPESRHPRVPLFSQAMATIQSELERQYRWGKNNQDGIWFSFANPKSLHLSVVFLKARQALQSQQSQTVLQRVAARVSPRLAKKHSNEQSSQVASPPPQSIVRESQPEYYSRISKEETLAPLLSAHRTASNKSSAEPSQDRSPRRSPEVSPRNADVNKLYQWPVALKPIYLFFGSYPVKVDTEIIEAEGGKC